MLGKLTRAEILLPISSILLGSLLGLGVFTFGYANGSSYLGNNPEACANCHVMKPQLDAWIKSSHGKFATCNDCHAPHNLVGKYYCKSRNGFFHSLAFTTGDFPDQIMMHDYNRNVVEHNCRDCHTDMIHGINSQSGHAGDDGSISCLHCHATVGHDTR